MDSITNEQSKLVQLATNKPCIDNFFSIYDPLSFQINGIDTMQILTELIANSLPLCYYEDYGDFPDIVSIYIGLYLGPQRKLLGLKYAFNPFTFGSPSLIIDFILLLILNALYFGFAIITIMFNIDHHSIISVYIILALSICQLLWTIIIYLVFLCSDAEILDTSQQFSIYQSFYLMLNIPIYFFINIPIIIIISYMYFTQNLIFYQVYIMVTIIAIYLILFIFLRSIINHRRMFNQFPSIQYQPINPIIDIINGLIIPIVLIIIGLIYYSYVYFIVAAVLFIFYILLSIYFLRIGDRIKGILIDVILLFIHNCSIFIFGIDLLWDAISNNLGLIIYGVLIFGFLESIIIFGFYASSNLLNYIQCFVMIPISVIMIYFIFEYNQILYQNNFISSILFIAINMILFIHIFVRFCCQCRSMRDEDLCKFTINSLFFCVISIPNIIIATIYLLKYDIGDFLFYLAISVLSVSVGLCLIICCVWIKY